MDPSGSTGHAEHGEISSRISREIVRLHANLYGRGPTKAKTHLADEYALCVLEEIFTPAERTLIRAGNPEQVRSTRDAFQDAVETEFVGVVEAATGRKVRAFASMVHTGTDAAFELFTFESRSQDDSSADGAGSEPDGHAAGLDGAGRADAF